MALRVARGLFRVWLVLSVLWIGGVGVVTWWTLPQDEYVVPSDKDDFIPDPPNFDPSKPRFDPSKPYVVVRDKERWEAVRYASIVALIPPAFLLAFGSALVWAFRGFR